MATSKQLDAVLKTNAALEAHMKENTGNILKVGHAAGTTFDQLYNEWIRARWDAGDAWVRSVWVKRP